MIKKILHIRSIQLFLVLLFLSESTCAISSMNNLSPRNPYFTGREYYLKDINEKLLKNGIVLLSGYGGVGKTQAVREFSHMHGERYDLVWWFDLSKNLILQYENLLMQLINNERFKKLFNIEVKNVSSNVIIDFINLLFNSCDCKWLLIFDNVSNFDDIKMPVTTDAGKHVIVTSRKKEFVGVGALTMTPFTDGEAENFLLKLHPNEGSEDIFKLYRKLHNYPLALAQASEEILMYGSGIKRYLRRLDKLETFSKPLTMHSNITQKYTKHYDDVLNSTIQEIEKTDKKASEVLYMLALLEKNLTKKMFNDFFGHKSYDKLMVLSQYGVVQISSSGKNTILNIHDVIRDKLIKRFNDKRSNEKKKTIVSLGKFLGSFYSKNDFQYLTNMHVVDSTAPLYGFINIALKNNIVNDVIVDLVIVALKSNDDLINKYSDYGLYQRLAGEIYEKNLDNISAMKKALLYANLVFSDFIFETKEKSLAFERGFLDLIDVVEKKHGKNHTKLFCIYTYLSKLYLFFGDIEEAKKYLEKAERNIDHIESVVDLLQYWQTKARICYELRDINEGINSLNKYDELRSKLSSIIIDSTSMIDLKIDLELLDGQKEKVEKELDSIMEKFLIYYQNTPSIIVGCLEHSKASIYLSDEKYDLAKKRCNNAIDIFIMVYGGDMISFAQVETHLTLGKIYEKEGNNDLALNEYKKCLKFYQDHSNGKAISFYSYGELLYNLCSFYYYKKINLSKSKFYFQELVSNFGVKHKLVTKLIENLPTKYMLQVSAKQLPSN